MSRKNYRHWLARLPPCTDEGSATAEFAVVLPSVIAIAGLVLALGRVVAVSMDCSSAASAAARELVVTGDRSAAQHMASAVMEADVAVAIRQSEQLVHIRVTCPVLPGPMNLTPAQVVGESTAIMQ
ncbi:pilus assembly protein [Bifidobacterium felsineum]|uniref:Pilus assembly protein TadE n=2 Tax=Bifidobacterium felsineum TaxID=2045440 RepID=A0A2M9HMU2_9BIFI|nr:pilus assembly protein [Bifidobacterium felsineum]PJM78144.1 pilus assembly protein TadE [Bifidobacterium felsineum]